MFGSIFYYDYFSRFCLFVFFTEVYYYPVAFEKHYGDYLSHDGTVLISDVLKEYHQTGSNGAIVCFQEKCMNESFDMDECCSELHHGKTDERIGNSSALNSILKELLDEKISTQRKNHWILGPEDLNDTLVYDFEIEEAA